MAELAVELNRKIIRLINRNIRRNIPKITADVNNIIDRVIRNNMTWQALFHPTSSALVAKLGLAHASKSAEDLLSAVKSTTKTILVKPFNISVGRDIIEGLLKITSSDFNLKDILKGDSWESYISYGREGRYVINWAEWLLKRGDEIVVATHHFDDQLTEHEKRYISRTGMGIMRKGGRFSVPSEHSGRVGNNLITRAFSQIDINEIFLVITRYI